MPLKVSSQGWVKVTPPPRPQRRRQIDPEEQKESLCHPLRYFACQVTDPSRERLRMLGGRAGFSSSEVDLLRPHSRLERSSTLDEWRWDTSASRSSSRQSGMIESSSPPRTARDHTSDLGQNNSRSGRTSGNTKVDNVGRRGERASSAPVVIPVSPPASMFDEQESHAEEIDEADLYPDHVSVAQTETPSERHCRHKHRHQKPRKPPTVIPEEEEEPEADPVSASLRHPGRLQTGTNIHAHHHHHHHEADLPSATNVPAPPPSAARSERYRSCKSDIDIPSPISETTPITDFHPAPTTARSEKYARSERANPPERRHESERADRVRGSSRSSSCTRSSSPYRSRRAESVSSYTASVRSASPVNDRHRERHHRRKHEYKDDDTESYYPSPPPSPGPRSGQSRHGKSSDEASRRTYRDRVVTAPASLPRSRISLTASSSSSASTRTGTWTSSSGSSRSSAPSINGYQLQAAIFQPKNYQGYRAPSLSKGNRWETATSALSFD